MDRAAKSLIIFYRILEIDWAKTFEGRWLGPAGQYLFYNFEMGVMRGVPEWVDVVRTYRHNSQTSYDNRTYDSVEPVFRVVEGSRMMLMRGNELISEKSAEENSRMSAEKAHIAAASAQPCYVPPEVANLFRGSDRAVSTTAVALANSIRGIID